MGTWLEGIEGYLSSVIDIGDPHLLCSPTYLGLESTPRSRFPFFAPS